MRVLWQAGMRSGENVAGIDRWEHDQAELRAAVVALVDIVNRTAPPPIEVLAAARWSVARALLRYLPIVDRVVYARLRLHADPLAQATARRYAAEAQGIFARFEKHSFDWPPETAIAGWPRYRLAVRAQAALVGDRLDRETAELRPFLISAPQLPPARAPGDRNWAGEGWRFRALLGLDETPVRASASG